MALGPDGLILSGFSLISRDNIFFTGGSKDFCRGLL